MVMPKTLTRSAQTRITKDWHALIPSLGIYKPRHLLRRVGPLLGGICLDRDSGGLDDAPKFDVHFLGKDFPVVSLTLCTPLRTRRTQAEEWLPVRWHEEKCEEAVARRVRQSLLPLDGDLRLAQVLEAYQGYMRTPLGRRQKAHLYRDMIGLAVWSGDTEGAGVLLKRALKSIGKDETQYRHVGGRSGFEEQSRKLIADPTLVVQMVESQIASLGVGQLPVARLLA